MIEPNPAFVRDGRIVQIPAKNGPHMQLLDWLAQDRDPGVKYSEKMVNWIIGQRHSDTAALRRYLIDVGLMESADGQYWRAGGSVSDPTT